MQSDLLPIILTIAVTVMTVMMVIVGVYVIQVLSSVKKTLDRVNNTIDLAEMRINSIVSPLQSLGGITSSLGTGLKVFESFTRWLNRKHDGSQSD
jgi:hypothetical protein